IQDIVADEVPVLPLWQGKQYIATRDGITGTAYALNSSSTLQLWELGRGASGCRTCTVPGAPRAHRTNKAQHVNLRNQWPVLPLVPRLASGPVTGCGTQHGSAA